MSSELWRARVEKAERELREIRARGSLWATYIDGMSFRHDLTPANKACTDCDGTGCVPVGGFMSDCRACGGRTGKGRSPYRCTPLHGSCGLPSGHRGTHDANASNPPPLPPDDAGDG